MEAPAVELGQVGNLRTTIHRAVAQVLEAPLHRSPAGRMEFGVRIDIAHGIDFHAERPPSPGDGAVDGRSATGEGIQHDLPRGRVPAHDVIRERARKHRVVRTDPRPTTLRCRVPPGPRCRSQPTLQESHRRKIPSGIPVPARRNRRVRMRSHERREAVRVEMQSQLVHDVQRFPDSRERLFGGAIPVIPRIVDDLRGDHRVSADGILVDDVPTVAGHRPVRHRIFRTQNDVSMDVLPVGHPRRPVLDDTLRPRDPDTHF